MCWEFRSQTPADRGEKAEHNPASEMTAKHARTIHDLARDADKLGSKAAPDHTPTKETIPAE